MTDWREPFLATIREHVDSDAPRLVYADQLEERGECDLAEFIRVQVRIEEMKFLYDQVSPLPKDHHAHAEWAALRRRERALLESPDNHDWGYEIARFWHPPETGPKFGCEYGHNGCIIDTPSITSKATWEWRRGFVAVVRLPSAALLGRECERCGGRGWVWNDNGGNVGQGHCVDCGDSGRTGGIAAALGRLPGLERVEMSDKRAYHAELNPMPYHWYARDSVNIGNDPQSDLPTEMFNFLSGGEKSYGPSMFFASASAANDALAIAAAQWCRIEADEAAKKEGVTV